MKKNILLMFLIALMLTFVGCEQKTQTAETQPISDDVLVLAQSLVDDMLEGDFKSTSDIFGEEVKKQLDENTLKEAWDSTVSSLGEFVAIHSVSGVKQDGNSIALIVAEYENNGLKITLTFSDEMEIVGIFFSYETIEKDPVSNDLFEELTIEIGEENPLQGVLTIPKTEDKPPVVIMVSGSGAQDMDSAIYHNKPFEDIAEGLAELGIASLRYDDRYFTYPEMATELGVDINFEDEILNDVSQAIELINSHELVDNSKIYVMGHSLGGMLTPAIAHQNDSVTGIISVAGSLRPLYEISYDQNMAIDLTQFDDDTKKVVEEQLEQVEIDIEILRGDLSDIPNSQVLMGLPAGYQKSAKEFAGENFIDEVQIPILVLQGEEDFQIISEVDFVLWQETLAGRENATTILYPNLNHLMMTSNGKSDLSEYEIKGNVSQEVIDDIAEFVLE